MSERSYLIGSGDRALWLGLGPIRVGVLAACVLGAVSISYTGLPLLMAAIPIVGGACWCFVSINGTALHELTTAVASKTLRGLTSGRAWTCGPATAPTAVDSRYKVGRPHRLQLPAECGRLSLIPIRVDGLELGILAERARTGWELVCTMRVSGDAGFCLLDAAEQSRRLTGWGDVLTAVAGEYADRCRLQWIEHAICGTPLPSDDVSDASSSALEATVRVEAVTHTTVIAARVSTRERDLAAGVRHAEPLYRLLASRLIAAELVCAPLDANAVADHLRQSSSATALGGSGDVIGGLPGPVSRREGWDHVRTDDTWHRGFLITGWPRTPLGPAWLAPLLSEGPSVGARSVAVHFEAVRPELAHRRARAARQGAELDADDRASLGFGVSARERRTQLEAHAVEDELSVGHVQHRMAGVILVSAPSPQDLDTACRQTAASASAARLDLRPLHGRHSLAWAASMPLCLLSHRAPT